jgi:hypothetical protein
MSVANLAVGDKIRVHGVDCEIKFIDDEKKV